MKQLSNLQKIILFFLFVFGISLILLNLISVIFISVGFTFVAIDILLLILECGPAFWYWWVPFGVGIKYEIDITLYNNKHYEMQLWLYENLGKSMKYYNFGEVFYFLNKTDAMAFKLRWEK